MIRSNDVIPPPVQPFIRRAGPADVDAIYALELEAFVDVWDKATFAEALSYYPTTFFVAVSNGQVTGFIVGALEDTGENIYGHICNFAVSSRFQRRGIGRALVIRLEHQFALEMATAPARSPGVKCSCPELLPAARVQNVYQIGGYYKNGEAALVMMKWFRLERIGLTWIIFFGDCVTSTKSSINLKLDFHCRSCNFRQASAPAAQHPRLAMVPYYLYYVCPRYR